MTNEEAGYERTRVTDGDGYVNIYWFSKAKLPGDASVRYASLVFEKPEDPADTGVCLLLVDRAPGGTVVSEAVHPDDLAAVVQRIRSWIDAAPALAEVS